jgi:4-hydroxy-4-methyl-2-oxoglutarate aldolase
VCVRCGDGDNLAVHVAVAGAPAGTVLVVEPGQPRELGFWGEVLTTAAESRGVAGLVIDGGVRDVAALGSHHFPVFSAMVALPGAAKVAGGEVGGRVRVGDVDVDTGDWVVGDADGVAVVPGDRLDEVLVAGRARADKEAEMFERLRAGATTIELLGLDPTSVEVDRA